MFKNILAGFRKFYRRLFKVYEHNKENKKDEIADKKQMFIKFLEELGVFKFLIE